MNSNFDSKFDKAMTQEQFTQVVDAILSGKYSWACVLILRFAGYNPLHYIPYRTYNRLMKENDSTFHRRKGDRPSSQRLADGITDLNYLEPLDRGRSHVRGGDRVISMFSWLDWTDWNHN